jgi:predicted ATP-dependent protease
MSLREECFSLRAKSQFDTVYFKVNRYTMAHRRTPSGRDSSNGTRPGSVRDVNAHAENGENVARKKTIEVPEESPSSLELLAKAWTDGAQAKVGRGREAFRVPPSTVAQNTDPSLLPETPHDSGGLFEIVGSVARRALSLGIAAREPSFHVFVAAGADVMIEDDIVRFAERQARGKASPPDIVYVHDFDHPEAPRPIVLPAGVGPALVQSMDALIDKLQEEIPSIASADVVRHAQAQLAHDLDSSSKKVLTDLESTAKTLGFGIRATSGGVQTFPILHGKPVSAEQFDVLDESTKRALGNAEERLTTEVEKAAKLVRKQSATFEAARDEAFGKAAEALIAHAMKQVREAFGEYGEYVATYFDRVEKALIEDWDDLVTDTGEDAEEDSKDARDHDPEHATRLNRFRVNLLVSHEPEAAPPVIYETNPTYPNLFGYLERRARFGALLTDFTRIRAGSLHRASGGVLVVRAADLMTDPIIWERMKRILRERQIGAEDPLGPLGLYATSLRPVPVPIRVRVVLVGPPDLYAALLDADPDFASLFRVKVEVEPSIPRNNESLVALDAYLMAMAKEREWGTFDRGARAKLLDLATRLAGERDKLSVSLAPLEETAAFASALAAARASEAIDDTSRDVNESGSRRKKAHRENDTLRHDSSDEAKTGPRRFRASITPPSATIVTAEEIEIAWRERRERAGSAERHIRDMTIKGQVGLDTSGIRVGVVNGLSVYSAGDVEFGQPMRITAVVALGREGIVDVEREAQLGGAIHTKGVAILRGYLGRIFGQERPLSLRAQIAFEQSYGEIDGDSASSSELFAVLSAIADVGIDQGIAVTGSVNQLGEIQAIGGLAAKVEGFFDLCIARGLTGRQGVLMPRANLSHLVLREDVVRAIEESKFNLYVLDSVTQGIEILTGIPAGERDASGRFPASSVFGRVERRIIEIAERLREAEATHHDARESETDVSAADLGDAADFRGR